MRDGNMNASVSKMSHNHCTDYYQSCHYDDEYYHFRHCNFITGNIPNFNIKIELNRTKMSEISKGYSSLK